MTDVKVEWAPGTKHVLWAWPVTAALALVKAVGMGKDLPWLAVLSPLWIPQVVGAIACAIGAVVILIRVATTRGRG